jgi:GT2 family glycosyltransferase
MVDDKGKTPPVSIIIVSYNTRDYIRRCLASLYADYPAIVGEVIVIDNASSDGSADMIEAEFPQVRIIRNPVNLGYAKAVNRGIDEASGAYFLVLNPDIETGAEAVTRLWEFMEKTPDAGIAAAKLLNPDGTLQMSCRTFYTIPVVLLRRTFLGKIFPNSSLSRKHLMLDWDHNSDREVDWVTGACMIVRREAYEAVGGMDERFFLYFEDVDWCYRMKKHGWKVCYAHSSEMKHHYRRESAGRLPDRKLVNHLLSTFRFYDKWSSAMHSLKRERRALGILGTVLSDVILINVSFVLAYFFRYLVREIDVGGLFTKPVYTVVIYRDFLILVNIVCFFSFLYSGLYRRLGRTGFARDLVRISRAVLLSSLVIMAATYLTQTIAYSRFVVLVFWPIAALLVTAGRAVQRSLHTGLRRGLFDLRRVAVVGEDENAASLRLKLEGATDEAYDFVGYIVPSGRDFPENLKPLIGDTDGIRSIVAEHRVQEILVGDCKLTRQEIGAVVNAARSSGAEVKVVSEVTDMLIRGSQIDEVAGTPVVVFPVTTLAGVRLFTKYAVDFAVALLGVLGLLLIAPAVFIWQAVSHRNFGSWAGVMTGLWQVLSGNRSLVGPRRQVEGESMKPGLTGPWRVSDGRSAKVQEDRMDMYYLQNWSVSSDLEIVLLSLRYLPDLFGTGHPSADKEGG